MSSKAESSRKKKSVADIGSQVPSNFKFGIIVAVAIFWAEFLQSMLSSILSNMTIAGPILANLFTAIIASFLGYFILVSYRKLRMRIMKVRV